MPLTKTRHASSGLPTRPNVLKQALDQIRLNYYRYEVTTGVYCMTLFEKTLFNGFVMTVFLLLVWALFFYFPSLLYRRISQLDWLLTGRDAMELKVTLTLTNSHGTPVAPPEVMLSYP